jgi:hypothetical protein
MLGTVCYSNDKEVLYRVHGENMYSSDKKYSIPYKEIHQQYRADIQVAIQGGFISESTALNLEKSLEKRLLRTELRCGFHLSSFKAGYFISNILFSCGLGPREKLSLFKAACISPLKGGRPQLEKNVG